MPESPAAPAHYDITVTSDEAMRLDLLVAAETGLSRSQSATLIAEGHVLVDGQRQRASFRAPRNAHVTVDVPPPPSREVVAEQIPLSVLYEDEHLIVVDKAAGMVVHPAPGNWTGTLVNALKGRGQGLAIDAPAERAGLVHRLDKGTSGLMVVARTDQALRVLSKAMAERRVTRRYAALCWGHLADDSVQVDRPIGRDSNDRVRMAVVQGGRSARTDFVRLARFASVDLLRCHLHSGRTHQIRVHLASIGHPVVGDDIYGGGGARRVVELPPRRHFLHAAWLAFNHPITGAPMDFRSALPDELRRSLLAVAELPDLIASPNPLEYFDFYRVDR